LRLETLSIVPPLQSSHSSHQMHKHCDQDRRPAEVEMNLELAGPIGSIETNAGRGYRRRRSLGLSLGLGPAGTTSTSTSTSTSSLHEHKEFGHQRVCGIIQGHYTISCSYRREVARGVTRRAKPEQWQERVGAVFHQKSRPAWQWLCWAWLQIHLAASMETLQDGDLAATPPMGYNTWNDLQCNPSDKSIREIVSKLKQLKFDKLGYKYVVIDDCWSQHARDPDGRLQADPERFPNGIAAVAKFVHQNGFKFGIYTDRAHSTCTGLPGSMDHEELDASTFASWGVDFVKNDGCWDPTCGLFQPQFPSSGTCPPEGRLKAVQLYTKMWKALNNTGREILHAVCGWQPWYAAAGKQIGHMWRVGADVKDWEGVYITARLMEQLGKWHGPRGWNDPDMLLGSTSKATLVLTQRQARAQFSLWALMSAPLMLGVNMQKISSFDIETYSNKEVIRVNQDLLTSPAEVMISTCPTYPQLEMSMSEEGMPLFTVQNSELIQEVNCGSHNALNCAACPQGNGETWCNGDCRWIESSQKCILAAQTPGDAGPKLPIEESPDPWSPNIFRQPSMRQCHQVWKKLLSTGEVALVAINWGSNKVVVDVPLELLKLPWSDGSAIVKDLWYSGSLQNTWTVSGTLSLKLQADGGHSMVRLRKNPDAALAASQGASLLASSSSAASAAASASLSAGDDKLPPVRLAQDRLRSLEERSRAQRVKELMEKHELEAQGLEAEEKRLSALEIGDTGLRLEAAIRNPFVEGAAFLLIIGLLVALASVLHSRLRVMRMSAKNN